MSKPKTIHLLFEGEAPDLRFVEAETPDGHSVRVGRWTEERGYKVLVLEVVDRRSRGELALRLFDRATDALGVASTVEESLAMWHAELQSSGRPYPLVSPEAMTLSKRLDKEAMELATPEELESWADVCERNAQACEAKATQWGLLQGYRKHYARTMAGHWGGRAQAWRDRGARFATSASVARGESPHPDEIALARVKAAKPGQGES